MIATSTDVSLEFSTASLAAGGAVAVFVTDAATQPPDTHGLLTEAELACVTRLLASGVSRGKAKELHFDLIERPAVEAGAVAGYRRVLVAGLGKPDKANVESIRQAAGSLAKAVRKHRLWNISAVVPALDGIDIATAAEAIATGFLLASFRYDEYKGTVSKKKEEDAPQRITLTLLAAIADSAVVQTAIDRARAVADGQNFARTIASRPGNDINPPSLALAAQQMAAEVGLTYKVLDEVEMAKLGMGGILAVGAASDTPPRMIILEHCPTGASAAPLLVVGKAITFDTGGISIKGADKMGRMIFDKCGGMAVLGFMYAVAKLKLPIPIIGILSSAENTLGGNAYRPGDILRMYNGVTVEVTNTDAEGRLVLGDALAWGVETYKPSAVVDLATLTGGVIVALGSTMAGVMSNSDSLVAELQTAADKSGEKFWRLPLFDEHREYIKSTCADIVNSGGREGHPLQGGAFLSHFIPSDDSIPWAHLDIAGVADIDKDLPYYTKGATGWGVRTLLEWATARAWK